MAGSDSGGGSLSLAGLIDEHGEKVFYDLHHYLGLNLVRIMDEGSGYTPLQILTLINNLPPESATIASIRGGNSYRGWGTDRYLAAALIDAVQYQTYVLKAVNTGKGDRKPELPEKFYRPEGTEEKKNKPNTFAAMAAAFYNTAVNKKEEVSDG